MLAWARSRAVGARQDAAVGRGEPGWCRSVRSTPAGVTRGPVVDVDRMVDDEEEDRDRVAGVDVLA